MNKYVLSELILDKIKKKNFSKNSVLCQTSKCKNDNELKCFLFTNKYKDNSCDICNIKPFYNNKPLNFIVIRKNKNNIDNRLENLQLACPNCYSQMKNKHNIYMDKNFVNFINCIDCGVKIKKIVKTITLNPTYDIIEKQLKHKYIRKRCDNCLDKTL
tara:strand:- start:274 stop:747 length:474 start_codon:yes stop_codon:yes gene_type:complete